MQIFVNPNYNFLKWRFHAIALSALIALIGLGMFLARGANLGIDFAGGANITLRFQDKVPVDQLRSIVKDATIQQYGKPAENSVLLRLPEQKTEGDYAGTVVSSLHKTLNPDLGNRLDLNFQGRAAIAETLKAQDPDRKGATAGADYYAAVAQKVIDRRSELGIFRSMQEVASTPGLTSGAASVLAQNAALGKFNVLNQETVGPAVGKELQGKAVWAIVLSVLAMGIYVAARFDLKFGVAAIACLVHDVAICLAFIFLTNSEFEIITVASLLMVVGYSINDTVVVYDRVRENLKKAKSRDSFEDILNGSLNQTLSRTVLTGGSVMLVLLCLILFGGEVINQFAWLLLIGTIAGTYSTLTVVPAIAVAWNRRARNAGNLEAAPAAVETAADSRPRRRAKA